LRIFVHQLEKRGMPLGSDYHQGGGWSRQGQPVDSKKDLQFPPALAASSIIKQIILLHCYRNNKDIIKLPLGMECIFYPP
jgi:hypothetical protein